MRLATLPQRRGRNAKIRTQIYRRTLHRNFSYRHHQIRICCQPAKICLVAEYSLPRHHLIYMCGIVPVFLWCHVTSSALFPWTTHYGHVPKSPAQQQNAKSDAQLCEKQAVLRLGRPYLAPSLTSEDLSNRRKVTARFWLPSRASRSLLKFSLIHTPCVQSSLPFSLSSGRFRYNRFLISFSHLRKPLHSDLLRQRYQLFLRDRKSVV